MKESLHKFEKAHQQDFQTALREIKAGKKRSHWMWYIFPQLKGLGFSETSKFYAVENIVEAQHFLDHSILGANLVAITSALLDLQVNSPTSIFGNPDDMKLHSSITLFSLVPKADPIFQAVLDKYFEGKKDPQTVKLLAAHRKL